MTANMKIALGIAGVAVLALLGWWNSRGEKAGATGAGPLDAPDEQDLDNLRGQAHLLVWAGFHDRDEIIGTLPEVMDIDVDESTLAAIVDAEFARKHAAEKTWPERTDCDRLDDAFVALNQRGIFARQYQGYTQSDGAEEMSEALGVAEGNGEEFTGYCFYTAQDADGVIEGGRGLCLAFGTNLEETGEAQQALGGASNVGAVEAGRLIVATLREFGFETGWDESPGTRIEILNFDWKRRQRVAA